MKDFTREETSANSISSLVEEIGGKTWEEQRDIFLEFIGEDMDISTFLGHYDSLVRSSEYYSSKLALYWLEKKDRSIDDMYEVLPLTDGYDRFVFVPRWLRKPERTKEDLKELLPWITSKEIIADIVRTWIKKTEKTKEDLVEFLQLFEDEEYIKYKAVSTWLENPKATTEDLEAFWPFVTNEDNKSIVALTWLLRDHEATKEDFINFLPFVKGSYKSRIILNWLAKEGRVREDLEVVLPSLANNYIKSDIISTWLAKEGRVREDLVAFLPLLHIEYKKYDIASNWLAKEGRVREDLVAFLPLFSDEYDKLTLAKTWLKGQQDPDTVYSAFVELVKKDLICTRYDTESISSIYLELSLTAPINQIPDLCKDLYPTNERYQAMLFEDFVAKLNEDILTENKPVLKSFIQGLNEDEFALESLSALDARITIPPLEVLEISKNRFNRKYESIQEMLSKASREEAFDEIAAGESLVTQFGEDHPEEVSQASLCEIFSYYDFKGLLEEFKSILSPEFQEKITEEFSPSDKSPYISEEEFAKLQILFPEINLPEMSILASFLETKVGERVPSDPLTEEKIAAFKFGKSNVLEELFLEFEQESKENSSVTDPRLENLTAQFRELLSATEPEVKDVANFFAEVLDIKDEFGYIDQDLENSERRQKQAKLTDFFKGNKILIAHLLKSNGGLDQIKDAIRDIGDGCVANIATQFKSAVYRVALGEDFNLAALYGVFRDKISVPILNSGGDHLGGSSQGTDIFTYHLIANSRISPNGLVKALAEEFLGDGNQTENSTKAIRQEFRDEKSLEIVESIVKNLSSDSPEDFNQEYAKIAVYCALKKIPNLLENRHFSKLKEVVNKYGIDTNQPPSTIAAGASANSIAANSLLQPPPLDRGY